MAGLIGPPRPNANANAELEQRRAANEEKAYEREQHEREATRGEWMTQLPKLNKRGAGMPAARSFSATDVVGKQDASWVRAPNERTSATTATTTANDDATL